MFSKCVICGCTETNACIVDGIPCAWAIPGELCDNPACLAEAEARISADEEAEPLVSLYTEGDLNQMLRERA